MASRSVMKKGRRTPAGGEVAELGLELLEPSRAALVEHDVVAGVVLIGGNQPVCT
jgi:hypothetical protein